MIRECQKCKKIITGHSHAILCKSCSHLGIRPLEETKNKMSLSAMGRTFSKETLKKISEGVKKARPKKHYFCFCGKEVTWNRKHCKSCAMKIRFLNPLEIEKVVHRKENHYNWQNGKSCEKYGIEFSKELKESIRKRDKQICQICNKIEKLDIHHIDYNKKNNRINNLISLCKKCHMKTNYKRNYWTKKLRRIIKWILN